MKILPSYRYQLRDQGPAIVVYYCVMVGMVLLNLLALPFVPDGADLRVTSGGISAVTAIFSFILALCAFKDSFLLSIQHGASRRSQFLARLGALGTICGVMAVADEVYTLLVALLGIPFPDSFFAHSLYEIIYTTSVWAAGDHFDFQYSIQTNTASVFLSVVFTFFLLLAISTFGYLITVLNYRLGKAGKIVLWCGWPALLIAGSTFFDVNPRVADAVFGFFMNLAKVCFSTLPRMCLTCLVMAAVFSGLTWLLMRRAHVK